MGPHGRPWPGLLGAPALAVSGHHVNSDLLSECRCACPQNVWHPLPESVVPQVHAVGLLGKGGKRHQHTHLSCCCRALPFRALVSFSVCGFQIRKLTWISTEQGIKTTYWGTCLQTLAHKFSLLTRHYKKQHPLASHLLRPWNATCCCHLHASEDQAMLSLNCQSLGKR